MGWRKAKSLVPIVLAALAEPDICQITVELISFGTLVHIFRSWMSVYIWLIAGTYAGNDDDAQISREHGGEEGGQNVSFKKYVAIFS